MYRTRSIFSLTIIAFVLNGLWACGNSGGSTSNNSTGVDSSYSTKAEQVDNETNKLSAADYGEEWPLKGVKEGTVKCVDGSYVVFVTTDGTYAVNGAARSKQLMRERGWRDLDQVHIPGKSISPILNTGRALCE